MKLSSQAALITLSGMILDNKSVLLGSQLLNECVTVMKRLVFLCSIRDWEMPLEWYKLRVSGLRHGRQQRLFLLRCASGREDLRTGSHARAGALRREL